jgi:sugar phosphate permease
VSARWFNTRRGLIVGLLTASSATGQLLFLPLLAYVAVHAGWRNALGIVCVLLAAAAALVWLFMRDRPADVGLEPFGSSSMNPAGAPPERTPEPATPNVAFAALYALRDAARSSTFWILFATFFICGASTNGLIQTHFIPLCSDRGLPEVAAAGVLATMGVFDFFGTIASGWLSDRYNAGRLLFWYYGLRGLSLMYLPFASFNYTGLSVFAVFYGLDWIATVPPTVNITVKTFGRERANLVFGWVFAAHQMGAATAAFGAGLSRTLIATYLPAFFVSGALCLIAALLALRLRNAGPAAAPFAPVRA